MRWLTSFAAVTTTAIVAAGGQTSPPQADVLDLRWVTLPE